MANKVYQGTGHRKSSIAKVTMVSGKGKITVEPLNENETINFYNSVKQFANKKHIVLHEEGKINNKIDEMSAKIEQNKIITIKNKIEKSDSVYSTFEKIISSEFDRTDILDNNRFRGGKASNSKEWNGFAKQITDMKEYFDIMRNEKRMTTKLVIHT